MSPLFYAGNVMDKLNTKFWFASMKENSDETYNENIENIIRKVSMPIKAVLGKSSITVSDFVNLQVGDIIKLNSKIDTEMDVYVGNIKKFKSLPGTSRDGYAVRVTTVLREEG